MTNPRPPLSVLDELESDVEQRPRNHEEQVSKLKPWLDDPRISPRDHARVLRLLGVARNRSRLHRDALYSLGKAKGIAIAAADYRELSKVCRETAVVYAWRGDDRQASIELAHALAYANVMQDDTLVARCLAVLGQIEWEARRYDSAERLLRMVCSGLADDLPKREAQRAKWMLCQTLNRQRQHRKVLELTKDLKEALNTDERLYFLACLEEVSAFIGLGNSDAARKALAEAKDLLSFGDYFERTEYDEAKAAVLAAEGGPSFEESLTEIATQHDNQNLIVRSAEIRTELGRHLFERGQTDRAREVLCIALRNAVAQENTELAERIRSEIIKGGDGHDIEDLASDVEEVAGTSSLHRRFVLLNRLGKGGFGVVHKALDLRDGTDVALKRIFLASVHAPETRSLLLASLRREYGAASKLPAHHSIARVRDILMEPDGTLLVVQDYVDGHSLRELYRPSPQTARLLPLFADITDALAMLHGRGIVHRDLKPENVIVDGTTPVLIDFGIAFVDGSQDVLDRLGTPGYAAPEQMRGEKVDGRADIYALGKMIAEALGAEEETRVSFLSNLLSTTRKNAVPRSLRPVLKHTLAEDPKDRLIDLDSIALALRQALLDLE